VFPRQSQKVNRTAVRFRGIAITEIFTLEIATPEILHESEHVPRSDSRTQEPLRRSLSHDSLSTRPLRTHPPYLCAAWLRCACLSRVAGSALLFSAHSSSGSILPSDPEPRNRPRPSCFHEKGFRAQYSLWTHVPPHAWAVRNDSGLD